MLWVQIPPVLLEGGLMASFERKPYPALNKDENARLREEMEKFILEKLVDGQTLEKDDILDALEELFEKEGCTRRQRRHKLGELEWVVRDALWMLNSQYITDWTPSWGFKLKDKKRSGRQPADH